MLWKMGVISVITEKKGHQKFVIGVETSIKENFYAKLVVTTGTFLSGVIFIEVVKDGKLGG